MTFILATKYESVWCFVRGLRLHIWMATKILVTMGRNFVEVSYHARVIEEIHRKGRDKRGKNWWEP